VAASSSSDSSVATQQRHPAQLGRADATVHDALDVGECEPEAPRHQDPAQFGELGIVVAAVPGRSVDIGGNEGAELVVVPEHARRDPPSCDRSPIEHT
jgi:hypothetical protein